MIHRIFDHPSGTGALVIAGKTALIYAFLILGLRLLGKRELGQMSLYDFVMIVILGNAVQNAMLGTDTTLAGGLVAGIVLLVANRLVNELVARSRRAEHLLVGEPVLLIHDGVVLPKACHRQGITTDELMAALREHGLEDPSEAALAVLEVDGTVSIVPSGAEIRHTRHHFKAFRLE
ncbi:MAG TPA: YetF domain-containing protein [Actinomycetota bacterium]|nr:YetF domain-containing protein [Actinomycetota bacterium]